jgi:hypothetical protein
MPTGNSAIEQIFHFCSIHPYSRLANNAPLFDIDPSRLLLGMAHTLLRALVDDGVHALIRQQVVSLSGNVFTGGLEEPVFGISSDGNAYSIKIDFFSQMGRLSVLRS